MSNVLYVAVEPPWPVIQGGRARMAGVVAGLRAEHLVTVVTWRKSPPLEDPAQLVVLEPDQPRTRLAGFLRPTPRIVRQLVGPGGIRRLVELVDESAFDCVIYSHSYMAAAIAPSLRLPTIVDLANIESQRLASFAASESGWNRLSARLEARKARRWEPRTLARADLVCALSDRDADWAREYNVRTVVVPNGVAEPVPTAPSETSGPAVFMASLDYGPNQRGARFLIDDVWPLVRAVVPDAELVIGGRKSLEVLGAAPAAGVNVVGKVDDLAAFYEASSVILNPVREGAGRQLKVVEGLAHGRAMIVTPYSLDSVPTAFRSVVSVGSDANEFAEQTARLLSDHDGRRSIEKEILNLAPQLPTWHAVVRPMSDWMKLV